VTITTIVTDIEGTTTDIRFVHDVLFPYARKELPAFIRSHHQEPAVSALLRDTQALMNQPTRDIEAIIEQLIQWIDEDKKITPLKGLQGLIWEAGYHCGDFQGHVYPEVVDRLKHWHEAKVRLCIFSSGSIKAQKLLFSHTAFGDLTPLFSDYFDTTTGPKKEAVAYESIASALQASARSILFLSDVIAELDAAAKVGFKTCLLIRDKSAAPTSTHAHPIAHNFNEIELSDFVDLATPES